MEVTDEIISKLAKIELFSDFAKPTNSNKQILKKISEKLNVKEFVSGNEIIKEGDIGDTLYILFQGNVQVQRSTPSKERFAVVNLTSNMNVFFGEIALIDKDKRSASVVATTDCKTLTLTGDDFRKLCEEEPILGYHALYHIAKRMAASLCRSTEDSLTLYQALLDEVEGTKQD